MTNYVFIARYEGVEPTESEVIDMELEFEEIEHSRNVLPTGIKILNESRLIVEIQQALMAKNTTLLCLWCNIWHEFCCGASWPSANTWLIVHSY